MPEARWDESDEVLGDGIYRLALPLPGDALRAVNVYVIESDDGLTLVDSGWEDASSRERLAKGLAELSFDLADVRRVLVTHLHGDHLGQATYIARTVGAEVALGEEERETLAWFIDDPTRTVDERLARLHRAGAEALLPELRANRPDLSVDWDMPSRYLRDTETVRVGDRELQVIATPGHTKGHMCFLEQQTGLLFSGDHVLPHITPSIGFEPKPTDRSLHDFLSSLARVRNLEVRRVLPAHGPVFDGLAERVDELSQHHDQRLVESLEALHGGAETPYEVAEAMRWTRRRVPFADLSLFNRMLATLETWAHLELLDSQGRVDRHGHEVVRFEPVGEP